MEILNIPIQAGEVKDFAIAGEYIEVLQAENIDIVLYGTGGAVETARGADAGAWMKETFTRFSVKSLVSQVIKLLVTSREGGSRRYAGKVEVTGGNLDHDRLILSNQGKAFSAVIENTSAAGSYPSVQIYCPLTFAGKYIVDRVIVSTDKASEVSLTFTNSALVNTGAVSANLNASSPGADVAALRNESVLVYTPGFKRAVLAANGVYVFELKNPITINPGQGLSITANSLLTVLNAEIDWLEVPA